MAPPKRQKRLNRINLPKENTEGKELQALTQLIKMPDFEVSEFFQTLLKSEHHQKLLQKLPRDKLIDFLSRNYTDFLDMQQELLNMQLPKLEDICKAKQFFFEKPKDKKNPDDFDEASVLQIIDSLSSAVLQRNEQEILSLHKMIQEMKKHQKYKKYFDVHATNRVLTESYASFVDTCDRCETLLALDKIPEAIRVYLTAKQEEIMQQIRTNLNVNDSAASLSKEMSTLVKMIEKEVLLFKQKFRKEIAANESLYASLSDWISQLTFQFYQLIDVFVYGKEEIAEILGCLNVVLEASLQLETKGLSLQRQLKVLISQDLPLHIAKIIEVVIESINELLNQDTILYEMVYLKSIKTFAKEMSELNPLGADDFGKKCASNKGIILINSFTLILSCLCDEKWDFLVENVLGMLIDKIALNIFNSVLIDWDYYHIYTTFDRLSQGKVKQYRLFSGQPTPGVKKKLDKIKTLSEESWKIFENKLINKFWNRVLVYVPGYLWDFKRYAQHSQQNEIKPSPFSLEIVFQLQDCLRSIQYRLTRQQFEYVVIKFFEFLFYTFEFVLYQNYHSGGTVDKVFLLFKKSEKLYARAQQFDIKNLNQLKNTKHVLKIAYFTNFGIEKFAFEVYFITEVVKLLVPNAKVQAELFVTRLCQILAKEKNTEAQNLPRAKFDASLSKMIDIYKSKPQIMRNYLKDKKKNSRVA